MALKSAWELALERTAAGAPPSRPLTAAQKARLAELERLYKAKIAEQELTLQPQIAAARARGDAEAAEKFTEQLRAAVDRLRRKLEEEKEAVRQAS